MKFARVLTVAVFLLFSVLAVCQTEQPIDQATINKLVSLMREDGYDYHNTRSPSVFTIHFAGQHLKDIKVILALGHDLDSDLVVFVTVTEKRRMPVTTDFMHLLLKENHRYDQIKVGFDGDDDLSVRIDGSTRLMDTTYLKSVVDQVRKTADEIYGEIEPSLLN